MFHKPALEALRTSLRADGQIFDQETGGPPQIWYASLNLDDAIHGLPDQQCTRQSLLDLVADPRISTSAICVSIFAWGGMHRRNARTLLGGERSWLDVCDEIRRNKIDRQGAYDRFAKLRAENQLKGMGPAFFTKIIYFLMPRIDDKKIGYIMDQWLGCSVNVLLNHPNSVLMDVSLTWEADKQFSQIFAVSDHNSADGYEKFCTMIDELAKILKITPDQTEAALFSRAGDPWRNYVKQHRRAANCVR